MKYTALRGMCEAHQASPIVMEMYYIPVAAEDSKTIAVPLLWQQIAVPTTGLIRAYF